MQVVGQWPFSLSTEFSSKIWEKKNWENTEFCKTKPPHESADFTVHEYMISDSATVLDDQDNQSHWQPLTKLRFFFNHIGSIFIDLSQQLK